MNHRIAKYVAATTIFFRLYTPAFGQSHIGDVYVYGERDSPDDTSCNIRKLSAVAAVQATLRENRIPISYKRTNAGHVRAYVDFTSINFTSAPPRCVVAFQIRFEFFGQAFFPGLKRLIGEPVLLCENGGVMSGPNYDLQDRLNTRYIDLTRQCISEIDKDLATQ
jgi:hypothetical protein